MAAYIRKASPTPASTLSSPFGLRFYAARITALSQDQFGTGYCWPDKVCVGLVTLRGYMHRGPLPAHGDMEKIHLKKIYKEELPPGFSLVVSKKLAAQIGDFLQKIKKEQNLP
jgi:hypothetical protein